MASFRGGVCQHLARGHRGCSGARDDAAGHEEMLHVEAVELDALAETLPSLARGATPLTTGWPDVAGVARVARGRQPSVSRGRTAATNTQHGRGAGCPRGRGAGSRCRTRIAAGLLPASSVGAPAQ